MIFYGLALLATSVVVSLLWRYIARHRDLLAADVSDAEVAAIERRTAPSVAFCVVVALAILASQVAAFGYLLIAVLAVFRSRGDRTADSTA